MQELEKIIWISIILIVIISVKERVKLALPILLVLVGLLLSLTGLLPTIDISPEMIFYVVLPPVLFDAAWNTSIPDFKKEFSKISILAVILVFLTTTIVAVFVHHVLPGFGWGLAFVLGAIVSPPDAVAASSITKSIVLPKRLIVLLEGESLLNDASALIAYKCAVVAVMTGAFSLWDAGWQFLYISLGGVFVGIVVGFLFLKIYGFLRNDSNVETFAVVLLPFATYSLAEHLGFSGVLAVVILGMYLSWHSFAIFTAASRIQMGHIWDVIIFILNGLIFLILGMQLPSILADIPSSEIFPLVCYGFLIFLILVVVRLLVLFAIPIFSFGKSGKGTGTYAESGKEYLILSWSGMRGVVSLAAALALPFTDGQGLFIEQRSTVLFVSFVVIIFTLLIQGLTLSRLIKLIKPVDKKIEDDNILNLLLLDRSISYLANIPIRGHLTESAIKTMVSKLEAEESELIDGRVEQVMLAGQTAQKGAYLQLELSLVDYQRRELADSYQKGRFSLEIIRKKELELDFWTATILQEMKRVGAGSVAPDIVE